MMVPLLDVALYLYVWGIKKIKMSSEYMYINSESVSLANFNIVRQ